MKLSEVRSSPIIVVDIQPAYDDYMPMTATGDMGDAAAKFLKTQTGPILMFVNAENQGHTTDTIYDIELYWEERGFSDWQRVTINDKGYGYFRGWMDGGISDAAIIKVIRTMYQSRVSNSRDLFGGQQSLMYTQEMTKLIGDEWDEAFYDENISVGWTSVAQLKQFNGSYIIGGARTECLKEVQLLMNAFNIRYKVIDKLVY